MKWDGEWHITYEVFRDLGLAFAAVLVLIYLLIVGWFRIFVVPLLMMVAIPLTLVGIIPGHWALGRVLHRDLDDRLHRARRDHGPQQRSCSWISSSWRRREGRRWRRRWSRRAPCASGRSR